MESRVVRPFPSPESRQNEAHAPSLGLTRRMRRNRKADWSRRLVRENLLTTDDLIWPIFLIDSSEASTPVAWMPGVDRLNVDEAVRQAAEAAELGIPAIAPFPFVEKALRDPTGSEALNAENLMCRAVRAIKQEVPQIGIICDAALDPYTSHGHDGVMDGERILNDASVAILVRQALALADAGADVIAPSDMMDGRVGAIRAALDLDEGADMVMVKPGLPYLDVIARVKDQFRVPTFAYQVSGEYAMLMAAVQNGWLDGDKAMLESLTAFKRAGADGVLTYFAPRVARKLKSG